MVVIETLEGTVNGKLWFHYDVRNDVLYLRLSAFLSAETVAEETPDGILLLRPLEGDEAPVVGITVVSWWKRYGTGAACDSLRELERHIELWGRRLLGEK